MKRIILIYIASLLSLTGSAQLSNRFFGFYAGGGIAASGNYNVGLSGGINYMQGLFYRTGYGFSLFYQSYNMLYDNEAFNVKGGLGAAGVIVLNKSSYVFFMPKIRHSFGRKQAIKFYLGAGVGYNMAGEETMRKWDRTQGSGAPAYDSTINTTANINKLLFRVGFGFTQYVHMGNKWWFTITEDFGYVPKNISTTSNPDDPLRTIYSPKTMQPNYISLQLGISRSRF